mgnify:CR=1 FL=1
MKILQSVCVVFLIAVRPSLLPVTAALVDKEAASHQDPYVFLIPSVYPNKIASAKLRPIFDGLGENLEREMVYRAVSDKRDLINRISNTKLDLVIWGYIPELDQILTRAGFRRLLGAKLQVTLYKLRGKKTGNVNTIKAIGGLSYSSSLNIAKRYYEEQEISVVIKPYPNYFDAIKSLNSGEIDYIAGAPSFIQGMAPSVKNRYEDILSFPNFGETAVYVKPSLPDNAHEEIVSNYFIENTQLISNAFGTGVFRRNIPSEKPKKQ